MVGVRPFAAADVPAMTGIVRGLPEYFTDDVPGRVELDAAAHSAWVLTDSGVVAGRRWGQRGGGQDPGCVVRLPSL
jgi:hypothetical protein